MNRPIYYGYVITGVATGIITLCWGIVYSFGLFLEPLIHEFSWPKATISGAYSFFFLVHGFMYMIAGRLNDRFGPRKVVMACGLLGGATYILMGWISTVWHLYLLYGVLLGIGMGGIYVPLVSTVARWFVKKRGLMTGIAVSGISFGTMLSPPLVRWLITAYGWRATYGILGISIVLFVVPATQLLRRQPEDVGLLPHGIGEKTTEPGTGAKALAIPLSEAFSTRAFWMLCGLFSAFLFAQQVILVHIASYASVLGLSSVVGATILSIIGGSGILGRMAMGALGDKIGNRPSLIVDIALLISAFLWLLIVKKAWTLYVFAAIFGFSYGGLIALVSPMVAELFGLPSHGAIFGTVTSVATMGGAAGPVVAGYLFDITGAYTIVFLVCTALVTASFVLAMILRQD